MAAVAQSLGHIEAYAQTRKMSAAAKGTDRGSVRKRWLRPERIWRGGRDCQARRQETEAETKTRRVGGTGSPSGASIEDPAAAPEYPQFVDGLRQLTILETDMASSEKRAWVDVPSLSAANAG